MADDIEKGFKILNIEIKELSPSYNPDDFGRKLMQNTQDGNEISYSSVCEYNKNK